MQCGTVAVADGALFMDLQDGKAASKIIYPALPLCKERRSKYLAFPLFTDITQGRFWGK